MVKKRTGATIAPKDEKVVVIPVKLSKAKAAEIEKQTKEKLAALAALPPSPYTTIIPAPKLASMNPAELCNYVADKFPRIEVIPQYATCNPTVDYCSGIYAELFPLAGLDRKNITEAQRIALDEFDLQMRQNFTSMINSCANLSNGNKKLFALTAVATRKKAEKHNGQLLAPVFTIKANKGPNKIWVKIERMDFAKDYRVYFGPGTYDKATWDSQLGGCFQTIKNLTAGENIGVIVVAIGKTGEGDWANPQYIRVPFN